MPKTKNIILTAFFVALALIIPYATAHAFALSGNVFLPMHIPVLLCGLVLGWRAGLICGVLSPILSSVLTAMPPAYPMLPIMTCELAVYGLVSGIFSRKFNIYISLIFAMLAGRLAYAAAFYILLINNPALKAATAWSATLTGIFGIIIQILIIPPLALLLQGNKRYIYRKRFDCIIDDLKLNGNGVKPLLQHFDKLKNAVVYDKIIGKAAAIVCVAGGVRKIYGRLASKPAKAFLEKNNIEFTYDKLVDRILNKAGDGICPLENCVLEIDDIDEGMKAIKEFL